MLASSQVDQSLNPQVGGNVGLGLAIKNYCNFVVYTGKLDVISQDSQHHVGLTDLISARQAMVPKRTLVVEPQGLPRDAAHTGLTHFPLWFLSLCNRLH